MPNPATAFKWLIRLLYASLLVFLTAYIVRNLSTILAYDYELKPVWFFWGMVAIFLSYLLAAAVWKHFVRTYGVASGYLLAGKSWFQSQLGKYIPGKVSLILFRLNAYPGRVRKKVAVAAMFEYITTQGASCLIILSALALTPLGLPDTIRIAALLGICTSLLLLWPPFFLPIVNKLFATLKQAPLENAPSYGRSLQFILIYTFINFTHSAGFFLVLASLTDIGPDQILTIAGIYQAAALAGILAVFAPAGIGVREGVLILALPLLQVPEPAAIVAVVMTRLITVAAELVLASVFTVASRQNQAHEPA